MYINQWMEAFWIIDIVPVTIFIFYATSALLPPLEMQIRPIQLPVDPVVNFVKKIRECTGWQAFVIKDATIHPPEIVLSNNRGFYRPLDNVYKKRYGYKHRSINFQAVIFNLKDYSFSCIAKRIRQRHEENYCSINCI